MYACICTYGYMYACMYACMHLRFRRALLACALPVASVRMPARRASSHLPVIAGIYFMHVCMLDAMCVCVHRALLVCTYFSVARARMLVCTHFSVARARMLVRRTSSRLLVIARIYFMHVYVLDARYVRCRRVSHARAMSARYSCWHARPPLMNARSPVALLNVVASLPIRRQISACVTTTKRILLILAYRCACMLDTGRYHVYAAVVLRRVVPPPGRRSPSHVHPLPFVQCGCIYADTSSNICMRHDDQTYIAHSRVQMCMYAQTPVGIMCMLPSCSAGLCPLRVADHPRTPHLCSSASVVVAFLLVRQMW